MAIHRRRFNGYPGLGNFSRASRIQFPDRVTTARTHHPRTRGSIMGEVDYEYCEELVVAIPMAALTWYPPIDVSDEATRFFA